MEGLTEGRIVHYVLGSGEHRPAIVVRVWRLNTIEGGVVPPQNGCSNLQVFTDSDAEGKYNDRLPPVMWATSALFDAECKPFTWHWIEKA
jgi:hypothetical protein